MISQSLTRASLAQGESVDGPIDLAMIVRAAVEGVGCPHKVAATATGYHADYWSKVLTGERGITLDRLGRLPRDVQGAIVQGWGGALGVRGADDITSVLALVDLIAAGVCRLTIERRAQKETDHV